MEFNVTAAFKIDGKLVDDILFTVTFSKDPSGAAVMEIQMSIDDDGQPEFLCEFSPAQVSDLVELLQG